LREFILISELVRRRVLRLFIRGSLHRSALHHNEVNRERSGRSARRDLRHLAKSQGGRGPPPQAMGPLTPPGPEPPGVWVESFLLNVIRGQGKAAHKSRRRPSKAKHPMALTVS